MHRERNSPVLLGHEATGVILKKGSAVTHVEEGDTVLVTWVPRAARDAIGLPVRATLEVAGGTAESENVFTWADHTLCDEQYVVKTDANIKKDVTSIIGCAVMTGAGGCNKCRRCESWRKRRRFWSGRSGTVCCGRCPHGRC
jgi:Zn-dependent alcohol dehydrogenase